MPTGTTERLAAFVERLRARDDLAHHEHIAGAEPRLVEGAVAPPLKEALGALGVRALYAHQARALELLREGRNVVVMTPTASGKSLVYNVTVLEAALADAASRALYIFPLKGLEQDQAETLKALGAGLGMDNAFAIYDGDTSAYRRRKIRDNPPAVVITNPDMLHLALNPFHWKWAKFLGGLRYVVIDEIHTYRGVFGSHVAHVIRRLRRLAARYGSDPRFIACSATIANPAELARELTGADFELVSHSGAGRGPRDFIFIDPSRTETSPYTAAAGLFIDAVRSGLRTIAFTRARKITELLHAWVKDRAPDLAPHMASYRSGLLASQRRDVEKRLFSGELTGVISTSALELGVDIGGLDVCILVGYPGTVSSTWQRVGRAGRRGRPSAAVLVALNDALDRYFMRHPAEFFRRGHEAAVIDPLNPSIARAHLLCAAAEEKISDGEEVYGPDRFAPALGELEAMGLVRRSRYGNWYARERSPQRALSIRGAGEPFRILTVDGTPLGESGGSRVFRELHPGAVYLHGGEQYRVEVLDLDGRRALCRPVNVDYYTSALTEEQTDILAVRAQKRLRSTEFSLGELRVTETVTGYVKKDLFTGDVIDEYGLDLPSRTFDTEGLWFAVDDDTINGLGMRGLDAAGGLHAVEHAAIATLPLLALCDRMDLGGRSYYPFHPALGGAAVFIYDGFEGGIGLVRRGYALAEEWFEAALSLVEECACELSCPSCTQDPNCGNANDPLDRHAATFILKSLLES
ncbi:MAG TPA: DEAD/DEAH box helicase [Deltaproteobacteria bacterium]|nr:DEAD/DEAH box helicase [Deltaproteobacteria bacterium]